MEIQLLNYTVDGERLIEHAGRVCYGFGKKCYKPASTHDAGWFIRSLIKRGHESVVEHAVATFKFSGISRACSHQIVSHRLASYSQESQRYVSHYGWEPVEPPFPSDEARNTFLAAIKYAKIAYRELMKMGMRKEDARFVLPNATPTCIVMTANLREWRHFIKMRCDKAAQWEIRDVALQVLERLYNTYSNVFVDLYEEFCSA